MNSRYGESQTAYREVQERHADIQRIERTLGELAQLFNDVSGLPVFYIYSDLITRCVDERARRAAR